MSTQNTLLYLELKKEKKQVDNNKNRIRHIRKTNKVFDQEKKMWRESYVLFNWLELVVYKVAKGYPCSEYRVITKYQLKFYDRKSNY